MFDNLGKGLSKIFNRLVTGTSVDRRAVEELLSEMKKVLLESDVDVKLADELIGNIKKRSFDEKVPAGMTLREHVLKVVYDELVKLLGGEPSPISGKKRIMLVGLFGSGKTTTAGKLAKYFIKQGIKPALIGADFHRPAALDQITQVGNQIGVPVFYDDDPYSSVKLGMQKFFSRDVVIVDTAGRNALDKELADELKELGEIFQPDEVLLVIPADLGKVARTQAEKFHKLVGITGVIITKMDGTARAGGALAATSVTGAKVKFIGVGERVDEFEKYDPARFVSRLLGLGDLQTLLEKAKEANIPKESVEKIVEGKFTLQEFMEQIESMSNMGPLTKVIGMIPGIGARIPKEVLEQHESKMKVYKFIIQSMTKKERADPSIITVSRIKRIAKGSGRTEAEVRELLNQYNTMKKMMKQFGGAAGLQRGQLKDLVKQFGFKI